jgi:hypothetical protein
LCFLHSSMFFVSETLKKEFCHSVYYIGTYLGTCVHRTHTDRNFRVLFQSMTNYLCM